MNTRSSTHRAAAIGMSQIDPVPSTSATGPGTSTIPTSAGPPIPSSTSGTRSDDTDDVDDRVGGATSDTAPLPDPEHQAALMARIAELEQRLRESEAAQERGRHRTGTADTVADFRAILGRPENTNESLAEPTENRSRNTDVKLNKPPEFDGRPDQVVNFLTQVGMYTAMMPRAFNEDSKKVIFAASFLRGSAGQWWTAMSRKRPVPTWTQDFEAFGREFEHYFGRPDRKQDAALCMESLRQTGSTAEYYTKFLSYAVEAELGDTAEVMLFKRGLKSEVLESMARVADLPETLQEYANLAIRIDRQIYDLKRGSRLPSESTRDNTKSSQRPHSNARTTMPTRGSTAPVVRAQVQVTPRPAATPYRPPPHSLSPEERQRRIEKGLCLICGQPGHIAADCPKRRTGPTYSAAVVSPTPPATSPQSKNSRAPTLPTTQPSRAQ